MKQFTSIYFYEWYHFENHIPLSGKTTNKDH